MGNYFWDTSALVKRYHLEAGTDEVNALLQREDVRVYISDLSIIEIHSALARKVRKGSLAEEGYWKACGFFLDEVRKGIFAVEEVGDGTKRRAVDPGGGPSRRGPKPGELGCRAMGDQT